MSTRSPTIDIARAAAVLLVVPFHASYEVSVSPWIDLFQNVAGGLRMPLLMFICGFLTSRSSRFLERVVNLVWLFVIWSIIILVSESAYKGTELTSASIASQFINPTTGLWFVWAVAGMTISLPFLKKRALLTLAIVASLSMLNDAVQPDWGNSVGYRQTLSHGVYFYIGAFYGGRLIESIESKGRSVFWLVPVLVALRLFDYFTVQALGWQVLGLAERLIAICLALHLAAELHRLPVIGPQLVKVGQKTLPLYLGHFTFIYVGVQLFGYLLPTSLALVMITAFALVGSIVLHRVSSVLGAPWLYQVPDQVVIFSRDLAKGRSLVGQRVS